MTLKISTGHPNFVLLMRELARAPASCLELEQALGINHRSVIKHINYGREQGVIRIVSWEKHVKGGRPVYGLKTHPKQANAPRPQRMTDAEQQRRWRERNPLQDNQAKIKRAREQQRLLGGTRYRGDCGSTVYRPKGVADPSTAP